MEYTQEYKLIVLCQRGHIDHLVSVYTNGVRKVTTGITGLGQLSVK